MTTRAYLRLLRLRWLLLARLATGCDSPVERPIDASLNLDSARSDAADDGPVVDGGAPPPDGAAPPPDGAAPPPDGAVACPPPPACPGARFQPQEDTITPDGVNALWGSAPGDVWAVGQRGQLLHYNGATWSAVSSTDRANLNGVFGSAANDVWAVGSGGTIRHYDGAAWSTVASGTTSLLYAGWSAGRNDAWVVGSRGALLRWDGATWTTQGGAADRELRGVWGSGGLVYAVGSTSGGGVILRYRAGTWTLVHSDQTHKWNAIWGSGPSDIWVGGEALNGPAQASLNHYDGVIWQLEDDGPKPGITSISGSGPGDVWAVANSNFARYDGTRWTLQAAPTGLGLDAVFSIGANRVLTSGGFYSPFKTPTLARYDGAQWIPERILRPVQKTLRTLWSPGPGQLIAAGDENTLLTFNGKEWTHLLPVNGGAFATEIYQIQGADANTMLGAGAPGIVLTFPSFSGVRQIVLGSTTTALPLYGSWSAPSAGFLVGAAGTFFDRKRSNMPLSLGTTQDLRSVWAPPPTLADPLVKDLWISGAAGTLLRYDGQQATAQPSGTSADLLRLWGTAADDLWMVGSAGTILHWDGARLTPRASGTSQTLRSVYGTSRCEVWAVGDAGTVLRYDGSQFAPVPSNTTRDLHDVRTGAACEVWVSGSQGARLRYQR